MNEENQWNEEIQCLLRFRTIEVLTRSLMEHRNHLNVLTIHRDSVRRPVLDLLSVFLLNRINHLHPVSKSRLLTGRVRIRWRLSTG